MANDFINQFPYTDFHELNLDWLIKETKRLRSQMDTIQEEFDQIQVLTEEQIRTMIEAAILTNNITIYSDLNNLKSEITSEYQVYVRNQIAQLKIYLDNQDTYYDNLAKLYAETALSDANTYTDNKIMNYTMMVNPITGEYDDVRNVVNDIITYFHSEGTLTAGEYDALDLTAGAYDAYELTAYDYDFNGKNLLV